MSACDCEYECCDEIEASYVEGFDDAMSEAFAPFAADIYDELASRGLPILEGVGVRWDAATREFVFHDGEREVRLG